MMINRHSSLGSSGMEGLGMVVLGVMAVAGAAAWGVAAEAKRNTESGMS